MFKNGRPAGIMDQHKRMTRTLACLVASMTIGAAFLDWMRPDSNSFPSRRIELIARGSATSRLWQAIDVTSCPGGDVTSDMEAHFVIDRDGVSSHTRHWEAQQPLDAAAVVRIVMVCGTGLQTATPMQRSAAEALVRRLRNELGISPLQVTWPGTQVEGSAHHPSS